MKILNDGLKHANNDLDINRRKEEIFTTMNNERKQSTAKLGQPRGISTFDCAASYLDMCLTYDFYVICL